MILSVWKSQLPMTKVAGLSLQGIDTEEPSSFISVPYEAELRGAGSGACSSAVTDNAWIDGKTRSLCAGAEVFA